MRRRPCNPFSIGPNPPWIAARSQSASTPSFTPGVSVHFVCSWLTSLIRPTAAPTTR